MRDILGGRCDTRPFGFCYAEMTPMHILVVNVGSTSFKFRLLAMPAETVLAEGRLERIGSSESPVEFSAGSHRERGNAHLPDYAAAISRMMADLTGAGSPIHSLDEIHAVGFKTVMIDGIPGCCLMDSDVIARMEALNDVAPAHNPPYVNAVRQMRDLFPTLPLVGLFEPAFHVTMPDYAYTYGVPERWETTHGVRKLGFHGASHRYVSEIAPRMAGQDPAHCRLVSAHLGGSSSLCAVLNGRSIDTSMGMSPQSGVDHSTRNGDLDVFAVLHAMDRDGLSTADVRRILCKEAGLAGISGTSGDVRDIEAGIAVGNDRARLALETFCYNVKKSIGAFAAALGGLDVIGLAGGIGERGVRARTLMLSGLEFLGVHVDEAKNAAHTGQEGIISADRSSVKVVIVRTNEELVVARAAFELLTANPAH
jgi:acetate kinase